MRKVHNDINQRLSLLRRTRCSELAKLLGKNHATLSRDRSTLTQWRADELLILAHQDNELRYAIIKALDHNRDIDDVPDAFRSVVAGLGAMAALSQTIAMAIADQRVDTKEARLILDDVHQMMSFIRKTLIPSLEKMRTSP